MSIYAYRDRLDATEKVAKEALQLAKAAQRTADAKQTAGRDGATGLPGRVGAAGVNGRDGKDARPPIDGKDGRPGRDGADSIVPGPKGDRGDAGRDGKDADTSVITNALQEIRNIRDQIKKETELNNQQRICAITALENKHKELVADFKALRNEIAEVHLVLKALLDQNKTGADYVAYLQAKVAARVKR